MQNYVISLSANHGLIDDIMNASIKNARCSICITVCVLCVVWYVLGHEPLLLDSPVQIKL